MGFGSAIDEISFVLDTDILTAWRFQKPYVLQEIKRLKYPPALTSITVFEALHGFEKSAAKSGGLNKRIEQDRAKTEQLIQSCEILPFDQNAAAIAAYVFPRLSQIERNKHWRDLFIAATALAHRHGIATRNQKDFELIANHLPLSHQPLRLVVWKP
ncbi:MAG: type II toxin-antitoxin system VapC family toxin [Blastocatellia bacterium]|nr:type II toxin-antitoxin system VapC family toxin [Blastocatellia bacterium]